VKQIIAKTMNYNELRLQLKALLDSETKETKESWLEMDRNRMSFAFKERVPNTFINRPPISIKINEKPAEYQQVLLFLYSSILPSIKWQRQTNNYLSSSMTLR